MTISEADLKVAEAIIATYDGLNLKVVLDDGVVLDEEQYPAYLAGTVERMIGEGIAAGRAESAERIAELEALVEPLPVDAEGHKLTLGMTVFAEREFGMDTGTTLVLGPDAVRVQLRGNVWEWYPLAKVHRDNPKPLSGLLGLLKRYPGWDLLRLGKSIGLPNHVRAIASGDSRADDDDISRIAGCLGCSEDEVRAALSETKSGDE